MRRWFGLGWLVLIAALAGCSADQKTAPTQTPPAATVTPAPEVLPDPTVVATPPALETFTGPYPDLSPLLDGVCFDYLAGMSGQTWLWTTPEELAAFYDQVDRSERCPHAVTRGTFDFSGGALAGTVGSGIGCDAAYRFLSLAQDDAAQTQTLALEFDILPGCPYELVEPLLIAVPRPPDGYRLNITLTSP